MNQELIEQITKLVIAELEKVPSKEASPLSDNEIRDWEKITSLFNNGSNTRPQPQNFEENNIHPLSESEIDHWQDISSKLNLNNHKTHRFKTENKDTVNFSRF